MVVPPRERIEKFAFQSHSAGDLDSLRLITNHNQGLSNVLAAEDDGRGKYAFYDTFPV